MSERAEPTTALGMAAAMKDASKGTDVIGESVKTFSMMGGGKNQKGDVLMSADNVAGAIELIKKMIADDTAKKPAKAGKWAFRASPHAAFGKTIEDSFAAFLRWAQVGSDDEEEGGSPTQEVNVSAAFRRIEAHFEVCGTPLVQGKCQRHWSSDGPCPQSSAFPGICAHAFRVELWCTHEFVQGKPPSGLRMPLSHLLSEINPNGAALRRPLVDLACCGIRLTQTPNAAALKDLKADAELSALLLR